MAYMHEQKLKLVGVLPDPGNPMLEVWRCFTHDMHPVLLVVHVTGPVIRAWDVFVPESNNPGAKPHTQEQDMSTTYTPAAELDPHPVGPYSWDEIVALIDHHRAQEPDPDAKAALPTILRELPNGNVVDADWDPATNPNPRVWATRNDGAAD